MIVVVVKLTGESKLPHKTGGPGSSRVSVDSVSEVIMLLT